MYQGTNHPNCYRQFSPRHHHPTPQRHYYQGNNNPYPSWQPRQFSNFQNVEYKYWCETCDKGFRLANHLENHKLQHQKCNIDGCQYVAHPKVITRHIQMQHSTDLYKKISKLNNPEEIQKWREERKRKYPTKENIEKKKAEINEKIKRGEKMGIKHEKSKNNNYNKGYKSKEKQPHQIKPKPYNLKRKSTSDKPPQKQDRDNKICKIVPPSEETRTLKPFAGIQHLIEDDFEEAIEETCKTLIEDDDDFPENDEIKENKPEAHICGALTSLLCEYGSSDEEEIQDNIILTSKETTITSINQSNINAKNADKPSFININSNIKTCNVDNILSKIDTTVINQVLSVNTERNNETDNDSGPEETPIGKNENKTADNNNIKTTNVPKTKKPNVSKNCNSKYANSIKRKRKLPSTLLEKLLHKEIQYERNIILQCIRHIVNKNFFDESK